MINGFRIDGGVVTHILKPEDLIERIVFLVNEYTCDFINNMPAPVFNEEKYDKDILELVGLLLDKRLPRTLRPLVVPKIDRDEDEGEVILKLEWDQSKPNLIAQPVLEKRVFH